jgi:3',5'-cyclic AMP phosphodiesterase CpdA
MSLNFILREMIKTILFIIILMTIKCSSAQTINTKPVYELNKANENANYKFTFAQITDVHIGEGFYDYGTIGYKNDTFPTLDTSTPTVALENAISWINANYIEKNIKFVIVSGDLTAKAQYSEFMKFKQIMSALHIPYVPMIGNHDVWQYIKYNIEESYATGDSLMNVIFADVFEQNKLFFDNWNDGTRTLETYNPETNLKHNFQNYSFEYDGFIFYALDFNPRYHVKKEEPGIGPEAQLYDYEVGTFRWFKQALENNPNKSKENICVISHHPPIDNILFVLSNFVFEYDEYDKLTNMLVPYQNNLALWLSGHIHLYYHFPMRTINKWYNLMPLKVIPANKDFKDEGYVQLVNVYLEDEIPTSIKTNKQIFISKVYPNPSHEFLNIELKNNLFDSNYKIYDSQGKLIIANKILSIEKTISIQIQNLETGIYQLAIEQNGIIENTKFIKN